MAKTSKPSLAETHPEIAAQADGWDPTTSTYGSGEKRLWRCRAGHQWSARVSDRRRGTGCPFCSGLRVLPGVNDLATTHPALSLEAQEWDPTNLKAGSNKSVAWKCVNNHIFQAVVHSRALQGTGCPICSNQQLLVGYNDLATTHPELAAQADGWDPTTVIAGNHKQFVWKCLLDHTWSASLTNRTNRGSACPICANQSVLVGFNDLATTHPELATQADGWDPTTVIAGSNKKAKWICENGHRWSSVLASRTRMGVGCPSCAKFGYDPGIPGFLYFIDHFDLEMFQIGITNYPDQRLGRHAKAGWETIELRGPMDGYLTQQLETSCLHALEKRGAILGHKAGIDKFDGYSEAWTKDSLKVSSLKQLLDWVYEDDGAVKGI